MKRTRRSILSSSALSLSFGLAGCTTLDQFTGPPRVHISGISVTNSHSEPHLFDVIIRDAETDTVVFWERYQAKAAAENSDGLTTTGGTHWDRPVDGSGNYVLYADTDQETEERDNNWSTIDLAEQGDCVGVSMIIDRDANFSIGIKYPENCQEAPLGNQSNEQLS